MCCGLNRGSGKTQRAKELRELGVEMGIELLRKELNVSYHVLNRTSSVESLGGYPRTVAIVDAVMATLKYPFIESVTHGVDEGLALSISSLRAESGKCGGRDCKNPFFCLRSSDPRNNHVMVKFLAIR